MPLAMTIRELLRKIYLELERTKEVFGDMINKILTGQFLDLTLEQVLLFGIAIFWILFFLVWVVLRRDTEE